MIEAPRAVEVKWQITAAIHAGLEVCDDRNFRIWAKRWLSGKDRSMESAYAASDRATNGAAYACFAADYYAYAMKNGLDPKPALNDVRWCFIFCRESLVGEDL